MSFVQRVPNLICIGMEKSGTTFLNTVFEHSQSVLTPRKKELFYFNLNYHEGLDWYLSWYDYSAKPQASYVCDITPSYFRRKQAVARIKETSPNAKLLILVRHPVYRAFSHYIHRLRHVGVKLESYSASFADVLAGARGKRDVFPSYHESLSAWLECFDRDDMLFLSYESDLFSASTIEKKLHDFLGIDDLDFNRFQSHRINDGKMPKFYYGGQHGKNFMLNSSEYLIPANTLVFAHAKGCQVWEDIDPSLARSNMEAALGWTDTLTSAAADEIYATYYAEDVENFSRTFGVDTGDWSRSDAVTYRAALPANQFLVRPR